MKIKPDGIRTMSVLLDLYCFRIAYETQWYTRVENTHTHTKNLNIEFLF